MCTHSRSSYEGETRLNAIIISPTTVQLAWIVFSLHAGPAGLRVAQSAWAVGQTLARHADSTSALTLVHKLTHITASTGAENCAERIRIIIVVVIKKKKKKRCLPLSANIYLPVLVNTLEGWQT